MWVGSCAYLIYGGWKVMYVPGEDIAGVTVALVIFGVSTIGLALSYLGE